MILNDLFIQKKIKPLLIKLYIVISLLLSGLIISIIFCIRYESYFSYVQALILFSVISLIFIIPSFYIYIKHVRYLIQLKRFIHAHVDNEYSYTHITIKSIGKSITMDGLAFIPITCIHNEQQKIVYAPYGFCDINVSNHAYDIILSERFVLGVKHV